MNIKALILSGMVVGLASCGECNKEAGHEHGPNCNHAATEVKETHEHGPNCNHAATEVKETHEHGPNCDHDHDAEGHDHAEGEHEHGPNCSHGEEKEAEHVHGPNCNHGEVKEEEHVHGPNCNHDEEEKEETLANSKKFTTVELLGQNFDVYRACTTGFFFKPEKALTSDTTLRATIFNGEGESSLKTKAVIKEGSYFIEVEEPPALDDKSYLSVELKNSTTKEKVKINITK